MAARNRHRLSPRALTLTTFIRLFIADNFVHGIGGGRYDQVSDQIIRDYFKVDPPAFSVTTATLFFPARSSANASACPASRSRGIVSSMRSSVSESGIWLRRSNRLPRRFKGATRYCFQPCIAAQGAADERPGDIARWEELLQQTQAREDEDKYSSIASSFMPSRHGSA